MQGDCKLQTCSHLEKVQLTLEQQTATGVYLYVNFFSIINTVVSHNP